MVSLGAVEVNGTGGPFRFACMIQTMVTISDVARLAQVSAGTVSNVLNRPSYVSEVTRTRVFDAMKHLGYVPDKSARQYRPGRSRIIGALMATVDHPFFVDVAVGAEEAVRANDAAMVILNSADDTHLEKINLDVVVQQRVQGILIAPVEEDNALLDTYIRAGIPVVFLDRIRSKKNRCSVSSDNTLGGRMAIEYFHSLGHRFVGFVGGPAGFRQVSERMKGAKAAAEELGMKFAHIVTDDMTAMDGVLGARELHSLPESLRPTGVLCANDMVALGVLQECLRQGTQIPEDLSIIGYDGLDLTNITAIPLTTIAQPRREMGSVGVRLLFDEIESPATHSHEQVLFRPQLIERDTCSPPSR